MDTDSPMQKGKNKKDELGRKITTKFAGLRAHNYSYLIDDGSEGENVKVTKQCAIKGKRKFENYRRCLEVAQLENKINYLEKNETDIDTAKVKK